MIRIAVFVLLVFNATSAVADFDFDFDWPPEIDLPDLNVTGYVGYGVARHEGTEFGVPFSYPYKNYSFVLNPISGLLYSKGPWTTAPEWYDCNSFPIRTKAPDGTAYFNCAPLSRLDYAPTVEARYLFKDLVFVGVGMRGGYGSSAYGLLEFRTKSSVFYQGLSISSGLNFCLRIGPKYQGYSVELEF